MTTQYRHAVRDHLLDITSDLSLSSTKSFGYNKDSLVNPFIEYRGEEGSSPSPTISSTWSSSSEPSPIQPSDLSSLVNTLEQSTFSVLELRTDDNVDPKTFRSEIRYNNSVAQDFDSSGYLEPADGISQLDFAIPTQLYSRFGDYGTPEDSKDKLWSDPHFQVFSFGNERSEVVLAPFDQSSADSIPRAQRTLNLKLGGCKSNPYAMRKHWIHVARSSHSVEERDVRKVFSKNPKTKVATDNTLRASALRRKHPAKFKCPVDGCNDDFTRKHNLENHLRSHCGVTDLICPLCDKGFTTIPVLKRHQRSCSRTASRVGAEHPKSFLAILTTEEPEPKVLVS